LLLIDFRGLRSVRLHIPYKKVLSCLALAALFLIPGLQASDLKDSLEVVSGTNNEAAESQQRIDQLSRESRALLEEYRRIQNSAEYQAAHTRELQQLNSAQESRIAALQHQIEVAGITQQRILPLMRSMADALEKFVVLDLPFHHQQRIAALVQLKQRLGQPGLALPVKFRLLLEAWQLEQDYGVTIEAWRGPLELDDEQVSVEFLRVGRVALYYQSLDGRVSGYWDVPEQAWQRLDTQYNQPISEALRVAKKQLAPQLLTLPMAPPGAMP